MVSWPTGIKELSLARERFRNARHKGAAVATNKRVKKLRASDKRANNPLKYGLQSKRDLLPWEEFKHFEALQLSLTKDFSPKGVVERHLVQELASIIWRKHRIGPAESAQFYLGMLKPAKPLIEAASLGVPGQTALMAAEKLVKMEEMVEAAENLPSPGNAALHRDVSRNVDAEKLVLLGRYEAHLDRKFQRTLAMLLSLQKVRRAAETEPPATDV